MVPSSSYAGSIIDMRNLSKNIGKQVVMHYRHIEVIF